MSGGLGFMVWGSQGFLKDLGFRAGRAEGLQGYMVYV